MEGETLKISAGVLIPLSEIRFAFSRSGGKGGQNVNKVETKVELLFDVNGSDALSADQRSRIREHLHSKIDSDGVLHVVAQASRSQWKNREDALDKLAALLRHALQPQKKRRRTGVPSAEKQKRLDDKKRRGEIKKWRTGGRTTNYE